MDTKRIINSDLFKITGLAVPLVYGQYLQANKEALLSLRNFIGVDAANLAKGHLSDALIVPFIGEIGAWFAGMLSNRDKKSIELTRLVGVIYSGIFYLTREALSIENSGICDNWGQICKADMGDVIAFAIPMIALGILYSSRLKKALRQQQ